MREREKDRARVCVCARVIAYLLSCHPFTKGSNCAREREIMCVDATARAGNYEQMLTKHVHIQTHTHKHIHTYTHSHTRTQTRTHNHIQVYPAFLCGRSKFPRSSCAGCQKQLLTTFGHCSSDKSRIRQN